MFWALDDDSTCCRTDISPLDVVQIWLLIIILKRFWLNTVRVSYIRQVNVLLNHFAQRGGIVLLPTLSKYHFLERPWRHSLFVYIFDISSCCSCINESRFTQGRMFLGFVDNFEPSAASTWSAEYSWRVRQTQDDLVLLANVDSLPHGQVQGTDGMVVESAARNWKHYICLWELSSLSFRYLFRTLLCPRTWPFIYHTPDSTICHLQLVLPLGLRVSGLVEGTSCMEQPWIGS